MNSVGHTPSHGDRIGRSREFAFGRIQSRHLLEFRGLQWSDVSQWFPSGGTYNYWVEYWHKQVDTYNDLAYAFPYDDKLGASTNLNLQRCGTDPDHAGKLECIGSPRPRLTFTSAPCQAGATSTVTLTAQVAGSQSDWHGH